MLEGETYTVHIGSNLDVLPTLEDNSIDSIVTDPPYELGFMGKKWDSSGIAYSVELWKECLRVLKPGGQLLSFGGTRTWHRVAVAIEDAGFEVRDSIAWMYGSGFPKSLDVSKAIDKGTGENKQRQLKFVNWMRTTGLKQQQINNIIGKSDVGSHYLRLDQPAIATADLFDKLRPYLPEVPEAIERLVAERTGIEWTAYKNREVIGEGKSGKTAIWNEQGQMGEFDITAPSTSEAKQWEGWGTALKPAFEPIVVARKPLIGTVAENVLTHGTGALNIDGSRIKRKEGDNSSAGNRTATFGTQETQSGGDGSGGWEQNSGGRWPANVILDEYSAEILDEQSGQRGASGKASGPTLTGKSLSNSRGQFNGVEETPFYGDSGGASRFFYVAKASKRDRNEGLEGLPLRKSDQRSDVAAGLWAEMEAPKQNFHPTVKPTDLMRYLVKLVTPPNGTVLDPFTGSGSTGKAAILEGFRFIGCELTEDYIPIIEGRLKHAEQLKAEQQDKDKEQLF